MHNLSEDISIQRAGIDEAELLQNISIQTFTETFAAVNTPENMQAYIRDYLNIEKIKSELSNPDSAFYFARLEGNIIGYLKLNFSTAQTELKDQQAIEIERIYVSQSFLGKGIGNLLLEHAIQVAQQSNATYVWLGVWEENKRAIAFYQKNGFVAFDKHIFMLGNDAQTDMMMKRELITT